MARPNDLVAVLFDFLGTLAYIDGLAPDESIKAVLESLKRDGYPLAYDVFFPVYRESTLRHWKSRRGHEETYNKYWITDALKILGIEADPDGAMITRAVEAYFEPFHRNMRPLPGALETLRVLKERYRLGLISNFTHSPTIIGALDQLGMSPYFESVVISAEIGLRKPSSIIFEKAMTDLGLEEPEKIIFVGDDIDADIIGALKIGMMPVLISYCLKDDYRTRLARALEEMGDGELREIKEIRLLEELLEFLEV